MQYVLPLMLVVMAARLVGNVFTEGLYDIHIKARHLSYLEEVLRSLTILEKTLTTIFSSQTMSLSHETNALDILG